MPLLLLYCLILGKCKYLMLELLICSEFAYTVIVKILEVSQSNSTTCLHIQSPCLENHCSLKNDIYMNKQNVLSGAETKRQVTACS